MAALAFVTGCQRSTAPSAGCVATGPSCASSCDARPPQTLVDVTPAPSAAAADAVSIALMLATAWPTGPQPSRAEVESWVATLLANTRAALSPCGLDVQPFRAELVAVPAPWLVVQGNTPESWGGLAPDGQAPDDFNYALGERLTPGVRRLFEYARRGAPPGTIAVVVVDEVNFHAAKKPARAGALSFPPTVYHHADDFPLRNGVLVGSSYARCGGLPTRLSPRVVAHELGHMLLDVAHHDSDKTNLMSTLLGERIPPEQCRTMKANLRRVYGADAVTDPRASSSLRRPPGSPAP